VRRCSTTWRARRSLRSSTTSATKTMRNWTTLTSWVTSGKRWKRPTPKTKNLQSKKWESRNWRRKWSWSRSRAWTQEKRPNWSVRVRVRKATTEATVRVRKRYLLWKRNTKSRRTKEWREQKRTCSANKLTSDHHYYSLLSFSGLALNEQYLSTLNFRFF